MAQSVVLERYGGPEQLRLSQVETPRLGRDDLLIRQTAIGVNYHDVYVRSGLYDTLALPGIPGLEAVGVVEAVGPNVGSFEIGERIGYVSPAYGGYAEMRALPAAVAVKLPASLTDVAAAASLMKAMTVCVLVRRVHVVERGQAILVQAAAGGVGQLLCNWASHLGAKVIGTAGDASKAEIARRAGASHTILYREEDVVEQVAKITNGNGVAAAYDSVGADTFLGSMKSLAFEGRLVNFGQSSGPVAPFSPSLLASRSLSVSRPIVFHYIRTPAMLQALVQEVFAAFESGVIHPIEPLTLPLASAAEAHRLLEARMSPGGIVLVP
jgi:NADPH2:quinone reductase